MTSKPKSASASVPIKKQYLYANQAKSLQLTPLWRLIIPLLFQTAITLATPLRSIYTEIIGKKVTLETAPVDPYYMLRGNYVVLDYNISRVETLKKLPGWNELVKKYPGTNPQYFPIAQDANLYIIMQSSTQAWKPIRVTSELPTALVENQVALRGKYRYGSIIYGLERYDIPESEKEKINNDIFQSQQILSKNLQPILVQIKVDARGNAVPISMQVGKRYYQF
jgi:uncharacterized membrane-anchored protein